MKYINSRELSEIWGVSQRRIVRLAKENRIQGARLCGRSWLFPEDVSKPADGRVKSAKLEKAAAVEAEEVFRYPEFEYRDASSFEPPLNEEELQLKATGEAFYACRFEEANHILGDLPERTTNRYRRIYGLFQGCIIDITTCHTRRFLHRYGRLLAELQEDFPHKVEMLEYLQQFWSVIGVIGYYTHTFRVIPDYPYHETFLPKLANLCAASLYEPSTKKFSAADLKAHETNCMLLRDTDSYVDLQGIHLSLGIAYGELDMDREVRYHIGEALRIAEDHEIYSPVIIHYYYWKSLFGPVLEGYPESFKRWMNQMSEEVHMRYLRFSDAVSLDSVCKLVGRNDFILLHYALQNLTNKEVAQRLHVSVSTVGKRYSDVYAALGVDNKAQLVNLYRDSIGVPRLGVNGDGSNNV